MERTKRHYGTCLFSLVFVLLAWSARCQSSLHWMDDGLWLPVYEVKGNTPWCFTGDELVKGDDDDLTMLSAREFGPGFLKVEIIANRRKGVAKVGDSLRFSADSGWFEFSARVTATDDMDDTYFVMRFDRLGDATFKCRSVGPLKAGQSRIISLYTKVDYDMPKQLHFYSGMQEIRTNLVPESYSYKGGDFLLASN